MGNSNILNINGVDYIPLECASEIHSYAGLKYCVVRTYSAGVHIGYVKSIIGKEVELVSSRRLWRWSGAATLSQVAVDGCKSEKFTVAVPEITLTEAIEIIPCTDKAKRILYGIEPWTA